MRAWADHQAFSPFRYRQQDPRWEGEEERGEQEAREETKNMTPFSSTPLFPSLQKKKKESENEEGGAHDRLNDSAYSCNCCTNPKLGSAALRLDLTY